jgi:hypothetical protein
LPTDAIDAQADTLVVSEPAASRTLPQPGDTFGHYRITRLLGQGGMGAVFEAEDLDSGRRVALKVLGHRLDSPEARSRFFREGRLAASINHPNSVYVFGTEDIAGIPVIAMELVAGGTLQERVSQHGPMPVAEVVDSALQIIAGLEAAQRVGVLHRDIKPSNCFVEADGTVKIGDFGLSISTFVRTEPTLTAEGAFLGTPAFSSPEQLRGDELTIRSDIYSVGVTLYYLLTGHHPFEAPDLVRLLATVLERRADSPALRRPELPGGLCQTVLRCLEKDPEKRFHSYDELRHALLPYASAAPTPATLGLRFLAYCLDVLLMALPSAAINALVRGAGEPSELTVHQIALMNLGSAVLWLVYAGLLEGLWGASIGKFICGLRVARLDRTLPGVPRALLRAFILVTLPSWVWLLARIASESWASDSNLNYWTAMSSLLSLTLMALMFTTARRRNGFAGWHDLASATRVIVKSAHQPRPALPQAAEALPHTDTLPTIGPYYVLDRLANEAGAEMLLGFDARLLRRIWIRKLAPGSPPVPSVLRQLGRPGRLRWLAAQRTETEAWDAYEAGSGQPLLALMAEPQPWSRVRFWLLDLAEELHAAAQDGSLPPTLSLDRVWITTDGRARLLDFPAPGSANLRSAEPAPAEGVVLEPQAFLRQVASSALQGRPDQSRGDPSVAAGTPIAIHARQFLESLAAHAQLPERIAALKALLHLPAEVSRARRGALLLGVMAFPLLTIFVGGGMHAFARAAAKAAPEVVTLRECLTHYHALVRQIQSGQPGKAADRDAFETYIAGRFAPVITNAAVWERFGTRSMIVEPLRSEAKRILARRPAPSADEFQQAAAHLETFFGKSPDVAGREAMEQVTPAIAVLLVGYANTVIFVILPCLIGSLLFGGGALVKLLGIAFVDSRGRPAAPWRVMSRNLVAWSPFLLLPVGVTLLSAGLGAIGAPVVLLGVCAALVMASALQPRRGLADRLVGVWPVPK